MKNHATFIGLVIFILLAAAALIWSVRNPPISENLRAHVEDNELYLIWNGSIDYPMAASIRRVVRETEAPFSRIVFEISSPGGSVDEGDEVISLLKSYAEMYALRTFVRANSECASMCVPIYLQGETRVAAEDALFMFHNPYSVDALSGQEVIETRHAAEKNADDIFSTYFEDAGVSKRWIFDIRNQIATDGSVWVTGRELYENRSKVVSRIVGAATASDEPKL